MELGDSGGGGAAQKPKKSKREGATDQTASPPESPLAELLGGHYPGLGDIVFSKVEPPGLGRLRQVNRAVNRQVTRSRTWAVRRLFPRGGYEVVFGVRECSTSGYKLTINGISASEWCAHWDAGLLHRLTPRTRRRIADQGLHVDLSEQQTRPGTAVECWAAHVFAPIAAAGAPTTDFQRTIAGLMAQARTVTIPAFLHNRRWARPTWNAMVAVFPNVTHVKIAAVAPKLMPLPEFGTLANTPRKVEAWRSTVPDRIAKWRSPTRVSLASQHGTTDLDCNFRTLPSVNEIAWALNKEFMDDSSEWGLELRAEADAQRMAHVAFVTGEVLHKPITWLVAPGDTQRLREDVADYPVFFDQWVVEIQEHSVMFSAQESPLVHTARVGGPDNPVALVFNF